MNSTTDQVKYLKTHRDEIPAFLAAHGITSVPRSLQAKFKLVEELLAKPAAQDARSTADAAVLNGVTRKIDDQPAVGAPKPVRKPARKVEDVPVKDEETSKTETIKPRAPRKPRTPRKPLVFLLARDGQFRVHKADCRDVSKEIKEAGNYEKAEPADWTSKEDAIRDLWSDQIHESYDGKGNAPLAFLHEHGFVGSVDFLSCTDSLLKPLPAQAKAEDNGASPREHNQALAVRLVELVAKEFGGESKADQIKIANWLHALPTGGAGWQRYWPQGFARPTSAGWRKPE